MAEQHLDDADVGAVLQQMGGEAMPQRVDRHLLAQAGRRAGRTAGRMQTCRVDRPVLVAAGEQPVLRPRQAPIAAQDAEQLRRQHDVAVLAALALLDPDDHPAAVDVGDLQADHLRHAQSGGIGRRQRGAALQAWNRFQEAHDLVGAQHHRQLAAAARA